VQRGPIKTYWFFFLPIAVAGLLIFRLSGCSSDPPPSREELDAMAALQRVRAHVQCDDAGHPLYIDFAHVDDLKDADLAPLLKLPHVEFMTFDQAPIDDKGLQYLEGLTTLRRLSLRGSKVTDAGLVHLQKCTSLSELDLEYLPITDKGLLELAPIKSLHRVYIGPRSPITTAGIEALKAKIPKVNVSRK
jgi:hypothetical protein